MKATTYQKRVMVDHARKAEKWLTNSHSSHNQDLKICTLRLGMFHGERFVKAANTYLDTLIQGAA